MRWLRHVVPAHNVTNHATELREEERLYRIKAEEAMDHKARVEESKNTTVDDLTRGIINYKYLGFDFVKAKGNGLRYV